MIKINERFYINANSNQYILQEKTIIKDEKSKNFGKETFKDLGYYVSMEGVLRGIFKTQLREYISKEDKNSIEDLLNEIKRIEKELEKFKNV